MRCRRAGTPATRPAATPRTTTATTWWRPAAKPPAGAGNGADDRACAKRIFSGTLDGRLIAVDAATGEPCQGFGDGGQVDIKKNMGKPRRAMSPSTRRR